jgi:hypothetical protein
MSASPPNTLALLQQARCSVSQPAELPACRWRACAYRRGVLGALTSRADNERALEYEWGCSTSGAVVRVVQRLAPKPSYS